MTDGDGNRIYATSFDVSSSDFKQYELALTGQPVIAYAWQIDQSKVRGSGATSPLNNAEIKVTLPDRREFSDTTTTT